MCSKKTLLTNPYLDDLTAYIIPEIFEQLAVIQLLLREAYLIVLIFYMLSESMNSECTAYDSIMN
jgi:hypothetical protein